MTQGCEQQSILFLYFRLGPEFSPQLQNAQKLLIPSARWPRPPERQETHQTAESAEEGRGRGQVFSAKDKGRECDRQTLARHLSRLVHVV